MAGRMQTREVALSKRFIVQFPDEESYYAAQAVESEGAERRPLENESAHFFVVTLEDPSPIIEGRSSPDGAGDEEVVVEVAAKTSTDSYGDPLEVFRKQYGAIIYEDYQYDLDAEDDLFDEDDFGIEDASNPTLDDVIKMINAESAWSDGHTGSNAAVAVIDTGVAGVRHEFPLAKRLSAWAPGGLDAWEDPHGHGSMCASIAAGTTAAGGAFNGVAPDAKLISCRTSFYTSELIAIYQHLITLTRNSGVRIVASNSYGRKTGVAPSSPPHTGLMRILDDAVREGIVLVFSAGNNHVRAGGDAYDCHPNSIWLHKGREDLLAVATCDLNRAMWNYSSRGPGQFYGSPGHNAKPDVTAPTPRDGQVVYGDKMRTLPKGWGTSGACPQVAGLAALMLDKDPTLPVAKVLDGIRHHALDLGLSAHCQGSGLIDVGATVAAI